MVKKWYTATPEQSLNADAYAVQSGEKIISPHTTLRARAHPTSRARNLTYRVAPLMFIARAEGYLAHGSSGENGKDYHWSMGL